MNELKNRIKASGPFATQTGGGSLFACNAGLKIQLFISDCNTFLYCITGHLQVVKQNQW